MSLKKRRNKSRKEKSSTLEHLEKTYIAPSAASLSLKRANETKQSGIHRYESDATASLSDSGKRATVRADNSVGSGSKGAFGPMKAPSNVRVVTRFDYAPDICKDYKETGYCGYGDTCKFMHDRGDYKAGWEIEKEWLDEQERKRRKGSRDDDVDYEIKDEPEEELPWACFICRDGFTRPVKTKCGHYFCEDCALEAYTQSTDCVACGEPTFGIFNTARDLIKHIKTLEAAIVKDDSVEPSFQ